MRRTPIVIRLWSSLQFWVPCAPLVGTPLPLSTFHEVRMYYEFVRKFPGYSFNSYMRLKCFRWTSVFQSHLFPCTCIDKYIKFLSAIFNMNVPKNAPLVSDSKRHRKPNPLPWFQLSIILLLQTCEPITSQSIYPYINQVARYRLCISCPYLM